MSFGTLLWLGTDLFLAAFPVVLAVVIARGLRRDIGAGGIRWGVRLPLLLLWLLFLPNTCYLLTEWRHYLRDIHDRSVYYPVYGLGQYPPGATWGLLGLTAFYLAYTSAGLLAFCLALRPLNFFACQHWSKAAAPLRAAVCLLCSLGVFFGLVYRLNSWDIIYPAMAAGTVKVALHSLLSPALLTLVCLFALILWLLYAAFEIWIEGASRRRTDFLEKDSSHASV